MFQGLQAQQGTIHPIPQVNAIRFLLTSRNQVRVSSLVADRLTMPRTAHKRATARRTTAPLQGTG